MEQYIYKNHKKLRYGYTTGSCAAAAAKAAAFMLLSGKETRYADLMTPKQIPLHLEVLDIRRGQEAVSCAVCKDGGDDPDVTNGIRIYAEVSYRKEASADAVEHEGQAEHPKEGSAVKCEGQAEHPKEGSAVKCEGQAGHPGTGRQPGMDQDSHRIVIDGGTGVGRITKPGLEQPVGAAAINRVPRQMIRENVLEICARFGYTGDLQVLISIPEGEALAEKTFNPRLGIVGGISVLGTSGIVEPMSEQALIDTIRVEIRQKLAGAAEYLLIVPGNYGMDFLETYGHGLCLEDAVKCSNFVGEALDAAAEFGAKGVLLVGHIGKFVKLAGGIMNTHSHNADARMELLTVHAALLGAPVSLLSQMMESVTTDDALKYLQEAGLMEQVMQRLMERMEFYVNHRVQGKMELGIITFSKVHGILGQTKKVSELAEKIAGQKMTESCDV